MRGKQTKCAPCLMLLSKRNFKNVLHGRDTSNLTIAYPYTPYFALAFQTSIPSSPNLTKLKFILSLVIAGVSSGCYFNAVSKIDVPILHK